jgi:PTH1 family peptidyl-tRNA hydrolase
VTAIQLIVGLGNPGPQYARTRHNAGFWFVDALADAARAAFRHAARFQSDLAGCVLDGHEFRLQKPCTYMNHSGRAVAALAGYYRIPVEAILVVHDDLDLPPGTVRLKRGGGHGGHNGLRDLIPSLGSGGFLRLRLGIGHPGHRDGVVDYVLSLPSREDRELIGEAVDAGLAALPLVVDGKLEPAMHRLHSRR